MLSVVPTVVRIAVEAESRYRDAEQSGRQVTAAYDAVLPAFEKPAGRSRLPVPTIRTSNTPAPSSSSSAPAGRPIRTTARKVRAPGSPELATPTPKASRLNRQTRSPGPSRISVPPRLVTIAELPSSVSLPSVFELAINDGKAFVVFAPENSQQIRGNDFLASIVGYDKKTEGRSTWRKENCCAECTTSRKKPLEPQAPYEVAY